MPSLLDIRRRVRAVKSTQQITKAMKMVAASRLRRAQERIQTARPFAIEMLRVLEQPRDAGRSGRAPAARRAARAAGRRQGAAVRDHRRPRAVRQLQHQRDQGREHVHRREPGARSRARPDRPARPRLFRAPRLRGPLRTGQPVPGAAVLARAGDRAGGGRGVHDRPGRQRLPGLQRVPLGHLPARSSSSGCCRFRRLEIEPIAGAAPPDRLPLRADAGGAVHDAAFRGTSKCRCSARCSSRTPRSTPRR